MAERYIQILAFANVPGGGGTLMLAHDLNWHGVPQTPDLIAFDEPGFDAVATATTVTVTNNNVGAASVNVWLKVEHTIERAFGGVQNTSLAPRPFVIADSAGGSGGPGNIVVADEGVPLGPFTTVNFIGAGVTAANAGSGVAAVTIPGAVIPPPPPPEQLLSIYGDGSFGNHTTAGDETWTTVAGAPGAPAGPSPFPFAFFNNLTISPGNSVAVGSDTENAVVIFVKGKLTIGAGARIHANGFDGTFGTDINGNPGGAARLAVIGGVSGGPGGTGGFGGAPRGINDGDPGVGGAYRPGKVAATMAGGAGGDAIGNPGFFNGGAGGVCETPSSWPYSLSQAMSIASLLYGIGGGNSGGGGAAASSAAWGGGGGGSPGTLVIFAKEIEAPAGSLQAIGGAGADGNGGGELQNASGGGGASGGMIVIVTENTTLLGVTNVSGGAGGAKGLGTLGEPGVAGGAGEAVAFNPMLAAQIPV